MKKHKLMNRETLARMMQHYDSRGFFERKRSNILSKNYGKQNTVNICQTKGMTLEKKLNDQLRKGIPLDKKDVQVMRNLGYSYLYPNEFYNDYLLENILKESESLIKKRNFYSALRNLLIRKRIILSRKMYKIKLEARDLRDIIEAELPELHRKIENHRQKTMKTATKGRKYWTQEEKETEIEKRIREAIFENRACNIKELRKYTKLNIKDICNFLNTTKNPLIKLWRSRLRKRRTT